MTIREIENSWLESETGILRTLRQAADRLERHVVPILHMPNSADMASAGSGVLVTLYGRSYLASAAHVFDHCNSGVFIPMPTGLVEPLTNPINVTRLPRSGSREDDRFDIGFVRLTDDEVSTLGVDRMASLDNLGGTLPIATTMFLVLGYPHRDFSIDPETGAVSAELTSLMTGAAPDHDYRRAGVDRHFQFLLRFDRRSIATKRSVGAPPEMTGISGGGVWPVSLNASDQSDQVPFFAGLVIERPPRFHSVLAVADGVAVRAFIERFDHDGASSDRKRDT